MRAVLATMQWPVVAEASNGAEAVAAFETHRPDLTLLDVNMPVKDGLTALREIRALAPDAVVVMLTSLSDLATIRSALEGGATQYLRKDTPVPELRQTLAGTWRDHLDNAHR